MKTDLRPFAYSPYAELFQKIQQWNKDNPNISIDPIEEQILYKALSAEYEGRSLFVSDLIQSPEIGSQATIQGRIKRLLSLGYINLIVCDEDNRKKIIEPTQAAVSFDQQRSIFLLMAANKEA